MSEGGCYVYNKREDSERSLFQQTPSYRCDLVYGGYLALHIFYYKSQENILIEYFCK